MRKKQNETSQLRERSWEGNRVIIQCKYLEEMCLLVRLPWLAPVAFLSRVPPPPSPSPLLLSTSSLLLLLLNLWLGTRVKLGGFLLISPLPSSCDSSLSVLPEYLQTRIYPQGPVSFKLIQHWTCQAIMRNCKTRRLDLTPTPDILYSNLLFDGLL